MIRKLAKVIEEQGNLIDYKDFLEHVFEREKCFPTAIGYDFAIPHGKCDSVKNACVAFAKLNNEIIWSDEEKVQYIFLIAVPAKQAGDMHLKILADLSRRIMREEFREKLKKAQDVDVVFETLMENQN